MCQCDRTLKLSVTCVLACSYLEAVLMVLEATVVVHEPVHLLNLFILQLSLKPQHQRDQPSKHGNERHW